MINKFKICELVLQSPAAQGLRLNMTVPKVVPNPKLYVDPSTQEWAVETGPTITREMLGICTYVHSATQSVDTALATTS